MLHGYLEQKNMPVYLKKQADKYDFDIDVIKNNEILIHEPTIDQPSNSDQLNAPHGTDEEENSKNLYNFFGIKYIDSIIEPETSPGIYRIMENMTVPSSEDESLYKNYRKNHLWLQKNEDMFRNFWNDHDILSVVEERANDYKNVNSLQNLKKITTLIKMTDENKLSRNELKESLQSLDSCNV